MMLLWEGQMSISPRVHDDAALGRTRFRRHGWVVVLIADTNLGGTFATRCGCEPGSDFVSNDSPFLVFVVL